MTPWKSHLPPLLRLTAPKQFTQVPQVLNQHFFFWLNNRRSDHTPLTYCGDKPHSFALFERLLHTEEKIVFLKTSINQLQLQVKHDKLQPICLFHHEITVELLVSQHKWDLNKIFIPTWKSKNGFTIPVCTYHHLLQLLLVFLRRSPISSPLT